MNGRTLEILTPEMVRLDLELADLGARFGAFFIDLALTVLGGGLLALVATLVLGPVGLGGAVLGAVLMLSWFVLRNFYFIGFELAWRGRTPGKRITGLRVVAADGGPLEADQVFCRNLTREAELFLPVLALTAPQAILPGAPVWAWVATAAWAVVLGVLPIISRRSARLGDLIGDTAVVFEPRVVLLDDVVGADAAEGEPEEAGPRFTDRHLDLYGAHELQVLEDMLRRQEDDPNPELMDLVCAKIIRKIEWPQEPGEVDSEEFLRAFYAAQRARLEHLLVLGDRRERKRN